MCSESQIMLLLKTEVELKFIYIPVQTRFVYENCSVMSPGLKPVLNKRHVLRCFKRRFQKEDVKEK